MDKPAGPSSHDVVARVRRLFGTRAVGHAGTLDPFATGLLVLVLGPATRLVRWAERRRKTYQATARLGQNTTTDDATGAVTAEAAPSQWPSRADVIAALNRFTGTFDQQPPRYSARQVGGVRSYAAARRNQVLDLPATQVTVCSLELLEYQPPSLTFRAEVSPGTYLRALARDIGRELGPGAHLTALRRERIGPWRVEQATPLSELTGRERLLPPEALVDELDRIPLTSDEAKLVRFGRDIERAAEVPSQEAGLYEGDRLVAVATRVAGGWHPAVVLPFEGESG